jgi:CRISPR/Cas system-associated exonuclease Cas4 (RecB family)
MHICKHIAFAEKDIDPEELWKELLFIHPEIDHMHKEQFMEYLMIYRRGFQQPWTERDLYVNSKKWDISGIIDKYDVVNSQITVIRGAKAPQTGAYRGDRLRAFAYSICLQEMVEQKRQLSCVIEYVVSGVIRTLDFTPRDRRLFLETIKLARRIRGGYVPARPTQAPCKHCRHEKSCTSPSGRRLSDIFRL